MLTDLLNLFTPEQYPPNEETGLSDVPLDDILAAMRSKFEAGWRWEAVTAGFSPDGRPFFVGNLTVETPQMSHTVPGSADLPAGFNISGAATAAFKNACLRGLGMGEALYHNRIEHAPEQRPDQNNTRSGSNQTYNRSRNTNNYGGGGNYNREWDGHIKVKSGEFEGIYYHDLPDDVIDKWANNGVTTAVKEQQRRMAADSSSEHNGASPAAVSAVRRAPWAPSRR